MRRNQTQLLCAILSVSLLTAATALAQEESPAEEAPAEAEGAQGWSPLPTGIVQYLSGCGVGVLSVPCNVVSCGAWGCLIQPAIVGGVETWIGDMLGNSRSAMIWPIVAAYGSGIAAFLVDLGIGFAFTATGLLPYGFSVSNPLALYTNPLYWARIGIGVGVGLVFAAAVPIVYHLVSVPKKPGDTGQGFPGIMEPADPVGGGYGDEGKKEQVAPGEAATPTPPPPTADEEAAEGTGEAADTAGGDDVEEDPSADSGEIAPFTY